MGAGDGADSGIAPDDRTGRRSRSVIDDAPLSGAAELSVCLAIGTRIDEAERSDLADRDLGLLFARRGRSEHPGFGRHSATGCGDSVAGYGPIRAGRELHPAVRERACVAIAGFRQRTRVASFANHTGAVAAVNLRRIECLSIYHREYTSRKSRFVPSRLKD